MKKLHLILGFALTALLVACNGKASDDLLIAQQRADSLQQIVDEKDGEIDALFDVLNQIEDNLNQINSKYSSVQKMSRGGIEGGSNVKGEINDQIANIETMLADNKTKLANLNAKLKAAGNESTQLQEFVTKLEQRISDQEAQITALRTELENSKVIIRGLNENINTLHASNQEKDATIARQTAEANKAYFIVGSYNELKNAGIVNKSGGFIGIGKKQSATTNMNTELFTMIDRTKVTTITVNKKKPIIITKHPSDSYELVADENDPSVTAYLKILNPGSFWRYTDYLVISTK